MSIRMRDTQFKVLGELRHEPTAKRVRATLAGGTAGDSTRAVLVWEPRRVDVVLAGGRPVERPVTPWS